MNNIKLLKTLPMIMLLILIGAFIIQLKEDKTSILNRNIQIVCTTSICVINPNHKECIYMKSMLSHLEISKKAVTITQTNTECKERN